MSKDKTDRNEFMLRRAPKVAEEAVRAALDKIEKDLITDPDDHALATIKSSFEFFLEEADNLWACFVEIAGLEDVKGYAAMSFMMGLPDAPFMWVYNTDAPGHVFLRDKSSELDAWLAEWTARFGEKPWSYAFIVTGGTHALLSKGWKLTDFRSEEKNIADMRYVSPDGDAAVGIRLDLNIADRDADELFRRSGRPNPDNKN